MFGKEKKEQLENFKCLVCGKFFKKTKADYDAFLEEQKDSTKHPNEYQYKILCPECQSHVIQRLEAPQKQIDNKLKFIKQNYISISSFIGALIGNIFGLFIISWEENQFTIVRRAFSFIGFLIGIYALQTFFYINPFYSALVYLAYLYISKKQ